MFAVPHQAPIGVLYASVDSNSLTNEPIRYQRTISPSLYLRRWRSAGWHPLDDLGMDCCPCCRDQLALVGIVQSLVQIQEWNRQQAYSQSHPGFRYLFCPVSSASRIKDCNRITLANSATDRIFTLYLWNLVLSTRNRVSLFFAIIWHNTFDETIIYLLPTAHSQRAWGKLHLYDVFNTR